MEWSPAGGQILYSMAIHAPMSVRPFDVGASTTLKVADVRSHHVERVAGTPRSPAAFGTWSPDGTRIAFMTGHEWTDNAFGFDPAEIWTMDPDGSNRQEVLAIDARAFGLTWSPSGDLTFSQLDGHAFNTYIVDTATHQTRLIAPGFLPAWVNDHTLILHR